MNEVSFGKLGGDYGDYTQRLSLFCAFIARHFCQDFEIEFIPSDGKGKIRKLFVNVSSQSLISYRLLEESLRILEDGKSVEAEKGFFVEVEEKETQNSQEFCVGYFRVEEQKCMFKTKEFAVLCISGEETIRLECSRKLFPDDQFEARMLANFLVFAKSVSKSPDSQIFDLDVMSDTDYEYIVKGLNQTTHQEHILEERITLKDKFKKACERYSDLVAVEYLSDSITFEELHSMTSELSKFVKKAHPNLKPGDFVGVCVEKSIELIVCIFTCWNLGCVYFPIEPKFPEDRLRFLFEDTGCKCVLCHSQLLTNFEFLTSESTKNVTLISVDREFLSNISSQKHMTERNEDDSESTFLKSSSKAYVSYTSGSTGTPKAVVHDHRGAWSVYSCLPQVLHFETGDRILFFSSISFDEHLNSLSALFFGVTLVVCPESIRYDPSELYKFIVSKKITIVKLTPTVLTSLTNYSCRKSTDNNKKKKESHCIKSVSIIGEICDPRVMKYWADEVPFFVHLYGSQETILDHSKDWRSGDNPRNVGSLLPNYRCYILDPKFRKIVPMGVTGEIFISGPSVSGTKGYLNRSEITKEKYLNDPFSSDNSVEMKNMYRTGDFGYLTTNGELVFSKRVDNMVKLNGMRVELGEIEECILKSGLVRKTIVRIMKHSVLVCFYIIVIPEEEEHEGEEEEEMIITTTETKIREYVKKKLPYYMVPHVFVRWKKKSFPLTISGKLDVQRILSEFDLSQHIEENYIPPRSKEEEILQKIFSEVLFPNEEEDNNNSNNEIGIMDDFHVLGGTSLSLLLVIRKIEESFFGGDQVIDISRFIQISNLTIKNICENFLLKTTTSSERKKDGTRKKNIHTGDELSEKMKLFLREFDDNSGHYMDEESGILYRHMTKDDIEECVKLDISAWHQMNPIYIFTGISEEEDRKSTPLYISAAIEGGTSLVAVRKKTGKIVMMNGGYSDKASDEINIQDDDDDDDDDDEESDSLLKQSAVGEMYDACEKKIPEEYLIQPVLNAGSLARVLVEEEEEEEDLNISEIYYNLEILLMHLARKKGYKTFLDDPNSPITQEMARMKVFPNTTIHKSIKFDEFEYPSGSGFFPLIGLREYYIEYVRREMGEDRVKEVEDIQFDGLFCCTRDLRKSLI